MGDRGNNGDARVADEMVVVGATSRPSCFCSSSTRLQRCTRALEARRCAPGIRHWHTWGWPVYL